MKKILVSLLAVVLMLTMSASVFAAGNFISSPSFQAGPTLVNYAFVGNCKGELVLVSYANRDTLSAEEKARLEAAYHMIADCDDLVGMFGQNPGNAQMNLAVSDLFYLGYEGCLDHDGHNPFTATIKPEIIDDLQGVYVLVGDKWVAVEYKVDGESLVITSSYYGPYAIVVGTDAVPETGDSFPWGYLVAMVVSAVGLVVIAFAFKKKVV